MPSEVIHNLQKLQRRLSDPDWVEIPAGSFLQMWRHDLQREAADRAPFWRGDIKHSILTAQDTRRFPLWARVFSDEEHAYFQEHGTGLLFDGPGGPHERYFPSPLALTPWSQSKGLNPWAVAQGIYQRGGLEPRHFFRDAEQAADAHLNRFLGQFGRDIERQAEHGA